MIEKIPQNFYIENHAENLAIKDGVNFTKCQLDKVLEAYKNGKQIEFEAFSPYLSDYNTATGEIRADRLTKADAIGLSISRLLREEFPNARLISLYDEYNSDMPDSSDSRGVPTRKITDSGIDAPQLSFPEETKENFRNNLKTILRNNDVIGKNDTEGKNYLFISESSKIQAAEKLAEKLETQGNIKRAGQAIYFINPGAENPAYREIALRTANGRWLCEALDASSYLDEKNLEITHLVVLPNEFIEQQNKVWEILRTLGIKPADYHNIFYDKNAPPEKIVQTIRNEIKSYK